MSELRGYPKREKKLRTAKRKLVGYDDREPEICKNCVHFKRSLHNASTNEWFPALCKKHEFGVMPLSVCEQWEEG